MSSEQCEGFSNWATWKMHHVVSNIESVYDDFMSVVNRIPWWDDEDDTWNDVDKAVAALTGMFCEVFTSHDEWERGTLFTEIDIQELVESELEEINSNNGRDKRAGLE